MVDSFYRFFGLNRTWLYVIDPMWVMLVALVLIIAVGILWRKVNTQQKLLEIVNTNQGSIDTNRHTLLDEFVKRQQQDMELVKKNVDAFTTLNKLHCSDEEENKNKEEV